MTHKRARPVAVFNCSHPILMPNKKGPRLKGPLFWQEAFSALRHSIPASGRTTCQPDQSRANRVIIGSGCLGILVRHEVIALSSLMSTCYSLLSGVV